MPETELGLAGCEVIRGKHFNYLSSLELLSVKKGMRTSEWLRKCHEGPSSSSELHGLPNMASQTWGKASPKQPQNLGGKNDEERLRTWLEIMYSFTYEMCLIPGLIFLIKKKEEEKIKSEARTYFPGTSHNQTEGKARHCHAQ